MLLLEQVTKMNESISLILDVIRLNVSYSFLRRLVYTLTSHSGQSGPDRGGFCGGFRLPMRGQRNCLGGRGWRRGGVRKSS